MLGECDKNCDFGTTGEQNNLDHYKVGSLVLNGAQSLITLKLGLVLAPEKDMSFEMANTKSWSVFVIEAFDQYASILIKCCAISIDI